MTSAGAEKDPAAVEVMVGEGRGDMSKYLYVGKEAYAQ